MIGNIYDSRKIKTIFNYFKIKDYASWLKADILLRFKSILGLFFAPIP